VHGLWLLVLLKLVTPPLIDVPVLLPAAQPVPAPSASRPIEVVACRDREEIEAPPPAPGGALLEEKAIAEGPPEAPVPVPQQAAPPPAAGAFLSWELAQNWKVAAGAVWLVGALAWFLLAGVRIARFRKLLVAARPAPAALSDRARRLARRMGLRYCPPVVLLPGRLAPLLWASGGTTLLCLSAGLLEELSPEAIDLLLVHELAHYRRGDHWVRGLEFFALGLYWWSPITWYARTRLREAEEQCCDAWVTATLPGSERQYATALVDTLDYLANTPRPVPTLASGLGEVTDLKRRLKMILRGTTPRTLGWAGGLVVLGLAALLPLWPRQADAEDPRDPAAAPPANRQTNEDLRKLQQELDQKLREIEQLRAKVAEAAKTQERRPVPPPANAVPRDPRAPGEVAGTGLEIHIEFTGKELHRDAQAIIEKIKAALPEGARITLSVRKAEERRPGAVAPMPREPAAGQRPPERRDVRVEVRTPRGADVRPDPRPQPTPAPAPRGAEGRIEELERRLDAVLRELEALRKEMREHRPGGAGAPAGPGPAGRPPTPPPPDRPIAPGAPPAPVAPPVPPAPPRGPATP
jgi:beta-lactamase regulating signal transducer with metallopeptidase domain